MAKPRFSVLLDREHKGTQHVGWPCLWYVASHGTEVLLTPKCYAVCSAMRRTGAITFNGQKLNKRFKRQIGFVMQASATHAACLFTISPQPLLVFYHSLPSKATRSAAVQRLCCWLLFTSVHNLGRPKPVLLYWGLTVH